MVVTIDVVDVDVVVVEVVVVAIGKDSMPSKVWLLC